MTGNTERDELLGVLSNTICNASLYPDRATPYLLGGDMSEVLNRTAASLLAAGFRRPRTIDTQEELNAVSVGAVIRDLSDSAFEKASKFIWFETGSSIPAETEAVHLPAVVLWEPKVGGADD